MTNEKRERKREQKTFQLRHNLSKENPTATEFDNFYSKEDPWGIEYNAEEIAKRTKLNYEFRDCYFNNGLDIGCGEGHLTASLKFVRKFEAVDISEVALKRAKKYHPNISFQQVDIRDLSTIENRKYDFISCLETLYYVTDDSERERIAIDIKAKGKENCVFCFSVVTIGENEHRRYFTYEEAVIFFKKHFNIIHHFPIRLGGTRQSLAIRVYKKLKKIFLDKNNNSDAYLSMLNSAKPEEAYQCVFVLTKN